MSKPKLASPRIRAVSLAVHSAGLSLMHAIYGGETELPVSILETLPTYYGNPYIQTPLSGGDIAG